MPISYSSNQIALRSLFFFFNDTATTEIYTLSLHDALPICFQVTIIGRFWVTPEGRGGFMSPPRKFRGATKIARKTPFHRTPDRKSTRLNSSHSQISYAVFCLKKKKTVGATIRIRRLHPSCG